MAGLTGLLPQNTYGDLLQAGNANAGVPTSLQQISDGLGNATGLFLSRTQIGIGGSDIGLKRVAAGIAALTDGSTGTGWLQQAGKVALAADFTDTTGTPMVTNLVLSVVAGRSYLISGLLQVSNSTATDGSQFSFGGGNCLATKFFVAFQNVGSVVAGTVSASALVTTLNYTTNTGTDYIIVSGYLKVASGTTFGLMAATNTHVAGTMTLGAGSWLELRDAVLL